MGRWRDPRKIEKVPLPCPVLDEQSWQIEKTVRIEKFESKLFGNGMVVLGLATSNVRKWSRYVTKAYLRHITMERQCLRWWMTARPCIHPLLKLEVLHLFRCSTHALPREGGKIKVRTVRWKWNWKEMKMRWRWKWDESYLTRTRRGERKRRGKEQTPTQANLAQSGQTLKGQGKRKAEADGHRTRPAEGGRTEAPKPTYHSKTYAYLSTRRTQPTCREENTWNRGPMGD